jgi:hypothetical protein
MHFFREKKIYILSFLSIFFIILGFYLLLKTEKSSNVTLYKNFCVLNIYDYRKKENVFLTSSKNFIKKNKCDNDTSTIPILNYSLDVFNSFYIDNFNFFLDSYVKIINLNPSILLLISEIKITSNELIFFLDDRKIRIDIKDYTKKNWEVKFISLVLWIEEKNIKKAFLDIREEDSLLIVDGEL